MESEDVFELVRGIDDAEHRWIDFKQDYYIGGIAPKTAEFIKDICSLANTLTDRDRHYILIGFDDDGNLVGISEGSEDYSGDGPRHFYSYDESDIQDIVDSNLSPLPDFSVYKFDENGEKFAVLELRPDNRVPHITTQDIHDDQGHRVLHRGLIFMRTGSGKKIVEYEDLNRIINYRARQEREDLLDDVRQIVELGQDEIESLGAYVTDSGGIPASPDSDAELTFAERQSREPATDIEHELNEDISQWKYRGDDFIEPKPLWKYYNKCDELPLEASVDEDIRNETIHFLFQSSIKNSVPGIFWLSFTNPDEADEYVMETPDTYKRILRAGRIILLAGNIDWYNEMGRKSQHNFDRGELSSIQGVIDESMDRRYKFLIANTQYDLKHGDLNLQLNLESMDNEDIKGIIPVIGAKLIELQERVDEVGYAAVPDRDEFRTVLADLEYTMGWNMFS